MTTSYQREEEQLERDLANGLISREEFNRQMRDMQRDYREEMQQAAWEAHDNELENWH